MHSAEAYNRSTLQKRIATDKSRNPMSKRVSSFFLGHIFYSRYATRCKIRDSDNERYLLRCVLAICNVFAIAVW